MDDWLLRANGSTDLCPALRTAFRQSPDAMFVLTDGLISDLGAVTELLGQKGAKGTLPSYFVIVGVGCNAKGKQNLRNLAQSFGQWSQNLAHLDLHKGKAYMCSMVIWYAYIHTRVMRSV